MHHLMKRSALVMISVVFALTTHADPAELSSRTISRTATSGLALETQLSKNISRPEEYQAEYSERVAYEDTETYYIDVPYSDQESYTDYEDYYSSDYVCENYTDYENQCRNERVCNGNGHGSFNFISLLIGRAYAQTADQVEEQKQTSESRAEGAVWGRQPPRFPGNPRPSPPGHGGFDPPSSPHPRPPNPHPGPRPEPPRPRPEPPRCHDEQRCRNVPVTKQRCEYQQVRHTRPVTKYRTITRYRQEARTRSVTKYRDQTKCCVTKYREVFDHQWTQNVQLVFPAGTELQGSENETFKLELTGVEATPQVSLTPISTVFGYQVVSQQSLGGILVVTLQSVPRYAAADLQQKSLSNLRFVATPQGLSYRFTDLAQFPRVQSTQQLLILNSVSREVLAQTPIAIIQQGDTQASLPIAWDFSQSYEVVLKIHREGIVVEGGAVDFEARQPLELQVDIAALKDDGRIKASISGLQTAAQLLLLDETVPYATVKTDYTITIVRRNSSGKSVAVGAKSFSRSALVTNAEGVATLFLSDIMKEADLQNYIVAGARVNVVIEVRRQTQDGAKIQFWKDNWLDLK